MDLRNSEIKIEKYRVKILEKLQVLAIKIISCRLTLLGSARSNAAEICFSQVCLGTN